MMTNSSLRKGKAKLIAKTRQQGRRESDQLLFKIFYAMIG
jgi:hypothetical protein